MVALLDDLERRRLLLACQPWDAVSYVWGPLAPNGPISLRVGGSFSLHCSTADLVSAMPLLTMQGAAVMCAVPIAASPGSGVGLDVC